jgi:hypothetical protein
VKDFSPWNEPNLCSSGTCNKQKVVAGYYKAFKKRCKRCTILAAEVVDSKNMTSWVRKYRKYNRGARLWGLHNYVDANSHTSKSTRALLKVAPGSIWFTETGGIVTRWKGSDVGQFATGIQPAAEATAYVFKLAKISSRIKRVYFYHWQQQAGNEWDSAFIAADGTARPSYNVLRQQLGR